MKHSNFIIKTPFPISRPQGVHKKVIVTRAKNIQKFVCLNKVVGSKHFQTTNPGRGSKTLSRYQEKNISTSV